MYSFEDFKDPIESACQDALARLHRLRLGEFSELTNADLVNERIVRREADSLGFGQHIFTRAEFFATAFDAIHPDVMQQSEMPAYFNDIISSLVRTGIQSREEHAGNTITQLIPDAEALAAHNAMVWRTHAEERVSQKDIIVYKFHFMGDIAHIAYKYDADTCSWNIGYGTSYGRQILYAGKWLYEIEDGTLNSDPINEVVEHEV